MKKVISIIISIAIIVCAFASAMPSFAVNYSDFSCEIVDNEIIIIKYIGTGKTSVTVPTSLDGKPVIAIADEAFKGNTELTTVTVKSGVRDIGASAFEDCTALSKITLPDTIIHIGEKAIYNTAYYNNTSNWRLKKTHSDNSSSGKVEVGSGSGMGSIDWEDISAPVLQYLYLGKNLIEIELAGIYSINFGTLVIADGAFKGSTEAIDVGLPSSIVAIGCNAFEGCSKLASVRNLEYVDYIGDNAFKDCVSLEKIEIADTVQFNANAILNTGYYNNPENWLNGALYIGNRVVGTSAGVDEFIISDSATEIIGGALLNKDVIIPETVTTIADNAFVSTENARIFGYRDSQAQRFAHEKGVTFVLLDDVLKGDVNFNGILDDDDYEILVNVASLIEKQSFAITLAGDMDDDGTVDGIDVIILDLMLNNMPPSRLKGDVNGDNIVDGADYELLVKLVSTSEKITDKVMFSRADINEDGAVDGFDVINLDLALNGIVELI